MNLKEKALRDVLIDLLRKVKGYSTEDQARIMAARILELLNKL